MGHRTNRIKVGFALALVFAMVCMGLLVSAPPARANHDTIAWSNPLQVAGATGFTDTAPAVIADGHGYVYVFYVNTRTADGATNVNVTKIQAVGPGGVPHVMFTTQVNDVSNVATSFIVSPAIDSSGNLYVAWVRATATLGNEVYVSKSTNGGVSWQPAVRANAPNAAGSDAWPVITVTPAGTIYVAWVQYWGGHYALSVSKSTDGGATFASWMNLTTPDYVWSPAIASDAQGRVYVAYGGFLSASSTWYDTNVTWSDDGVHWAAWQTLTNSQYAGFFPALAVDRHGVVHLDWFGVNGGDYNIRASESQDRGATWSTPISLPSGAASGYVGYLATEGDTLMYVWAPGAASASSAIVSGDDGATYYSVENFGPVYSYTTVAADQNGTFWASYIGTGGVIDIQWWVGPPSAPVVTSVAASGTNGLTVTWTGAPEQNVAEYQVWRSGDGTTYQVVATLSASATSYADTGLSNGTYWYKVTAVNNQGTPSHDSNAVSGVVGVTVEQLESEISALQTALNSANANLASLQTQLASVQAQLTALQNSQTASAAKLAQLQANLTALQDQINAMQSQQATQTLSYANLAFEIIVVVLLVIVLVNQMRKPKNPRIMMADPGQAPPKKPEDEL